LSKARDLYRDGASRQFTNAQDAQLIRRDRIAEVDEVIRQVQSRPQTTRTQDQLRQLTDHKRQLDEAMQRGSKIDIKASVPGYVTLSLGSAYFRMGDLIQAEKAYRESIDADARAGEAHNNLAVVYLQTGRFDEAERSLKAAEKGGFKVHPKLKEEIRNRRKAGSS
ncbi:MAG: tetratricopeptide repeat protein, partial [Vicinamibacterales bacterium]